MDFVNKKLLVVGAGVSGIATAKLAKQLGAAVCLTDAKDETEIKYDLSELRAAGVVLSLGKQDEILLDGVDYLVVSPAVPIGLPLLKRRKRAAFWS